MKREYRVVVESAEDYPFDDNTGVGCLFRETWFHGETVHRDFGPAVTLRHPNTLVAVREEHRDEGRLSRYGGPAIIERHPISGKKIAEAWFKEGRQVQPLDPREHPLPFPSM